MKAAPAALALLLAAGVAPGCSGGAAGGGHATSGGAAPLPSGGEIPPPPRNILIYLVDTLRADRMSLYGYERKTTPKIDRFAQSGVVFDAAYSSSPWTRTSVVTMFTGLHPDRHGVHDHDEAAPDDLHLMAEVLSEAGFETAAFSTNVSVSDKFNMGQGFDRMVYYERDEYFAGRDETDPGYVPVHAMFPDVAEWIEQPRDKPFFLYVHPTDPHQVYWPPAPYRLWGDVMKVDMYDGEVLYSDDFFGRTVETLRQMNLLDETLVILTADHGEELKERYVYGHGHTFHNELLRVPLVMGHPALAPGRRPETVRLIDLYPTLVEWMDLPVDPAALQGRSFLPLLFGGGLNEEAERPVLATARIPDKLVGASLQADGKKIIRTEWHRWGNQATWQLYDVDSDPLERVNLADGRPELLAEYRDRLERLEKLSGEAGRPADKVTLDQQTEDTLRTLGYLD